MKKDDAREAIVAEWDRCAARNPNDAKVMNCCSSSIYKKNARRF
jgi:hypothetical protein